MTHYQPAGFRTEVQIGPEVLIPSTLTAQLVSPGGQVLSGTTSSLASPRRSRA